MSILDLIIIFIFIFSLISGYKKGFVNQIISIFSFFIGIFIFNIICPNMVEFLMQNEFASGIINSTVQNIDINDTLKEGQLTIVDYINSLEVPTIAKDYMMDIALSEIDVSNVNEAIRTFFATIIINVMSYILSFVLTVLIVKGMVILAKIFMKIPTITTVNKTLGMLLGAISGILKIFVFTVIIFVLSTFPDFDIIREQMNGIIVKFFIENNMLINFVLNMVNL